MPSDVSVPTNDSTFQCGDEIQMDSRKADTERAKALSSFLPAALLNIPDLKSDVLLRIWHDHPVGSHRTLVEGIDSDLRILQRMEAIYRGGSDAIQSEEISQPLEKTRHTLQESLRAIGELIGGLSPGRLEAFDLHRNLARSKLHMEAAGLKGTAASLWAAACAVKIGCVQMSGSPINLPENTDFLELSRPEKKAERDALVARVKKCCDRYLTHSRDVCRGFSPPLGGTQSSLSVYYSILQTFVQEEQYSFGEFWERSKGRRRRNLMGKAQSVHRRISKNAIQKKREQGEQDED
jgi:hypothetical protein